ncbi:hypothetical protein EDWATA_03294 [Edwardsiella tarda ATCC 23685]|uniref:Uncharacterized protein n=1 Tax=Edwardsiella tarda ATCC 23685 TaxID=500638 RepID=D4F939_EDWTA|nr:hypothetical protein EDWATA_03294 [Edwardsiella tarda ATCC 23685]
MGYFLFVVISASCFLFVLSGFPQLWRVLDHVFIPLRGLIYRIFHCYVWFFLALIESNIFYMVFAIYGGRSIKINCAQTGVH